MGSTLLPAEDPAPSPRVGLVPGGDSLALGSLPWCQQVVWLRGDSHLPPTARGSLGVREPGGQRVPVFPGEGVVLALARESHPGGVVGVSEPGTCWALSCPGSSVSLQEGLAAGTAQSCSLPSLPAPELSEAAGSFPASLGSVPLDPGRVLGSARLLAVPCVGWLPGHGSSWLPSISFKQRFGLGFPFLERGAPSKGFLEGHFLL